MFQNHIHNMRGMAILGIVGAHSIHAFDWDASPVWFRAFDTLCNQSSILFFFIAGYLFQYLSSRFTYSRYLKKKAQTVLLPYLILSVPALVYYTQMSQDNERVWEGFYNAPVWEQVLWYLGTGKHLAPFWFVPTITLFYIVAPLLLWLDRKRYIPYLLLPLMVWSAYSGRDFFFGPFGKASYLLSVYLFGMAFSRWRDEAQELARRFAWPVLALEVVFFTVNTVVPDAHYAWLYLQKLFLIPVLVHWLMVFDHVLQKRFDHLANVSFGLFFVHGYLIHAARVVWLRVVDTGLPAAHVPIYLVFALLVLLGSLGLLALAQRTFGTRSRMLVGC